MADEFNPPPPPPPKPPPAPPAQQPVQQQPLTFSPAALVGGGAGAPAAGGIQNPFNPNPGIIAEAAGRGISPARFADAAGPISPRGTGYSYMTGRGSKVDVAGTPSPPRQRQEPRPPVYGGGSDYTAEEYF